MNQTPDDDPADVALLQDIAARVQRLVERLGGLLAIQTKPAGRFAVALERPDARTTLDTFSAATTRQNSSQPFPAGGVS